MESCRYLLDVALILLSTEVLGLLTRRIGMPQVVGALVAGLLLGPACFNTVQESEFLDHITEIDVIVLIFSTGPETDISELKKSGRNSFTVAVIGVLVPLIVGYVLAPFFNTEPVASLQNMLTGITLTAASVSVSMETLKEIGKLSTPNGNTILGVTLIDDILGTVALTIVTSMADTSARLTEAILKIVTFSVLAVIVGIFAREGIEKLFGCYQEVRHRLSILSFALCLLFVYAAEASLRVADITGVFATGLIISGTSRCNYVQVRIETLSYLSVSPVFLASIGLKVVLPEMNTSTVIFSVSLLVLVILTKTVGCDLGTKLCRHENIQSFRIGIDVVSRGKIVLIVINKGMRAGLTNEAFFGPIIIMTMLTTIITPILLEIVFKDRENDPNVCVSSELIEDYEKIEQNEKLAQKVLKQS